MSISDLISKENFDFVSNFDSGERFLNKIAHVQYANQANNCHNGSFVGKPLGTNRPFQTLPVSIDYGSFNSSDSYGYGSLKLQRQHLSTNSNHLQMRDRHTLSSFGSPSISSSASDSSSTSTSPTTASLHSDLSELGVSLSKLALHAEGAPIIICEEGPKRTSSASNTGNGNANKVHSRRRSYRLLNTFPPNGSNFLHPELDAFSSFSATSLSTAFHRYQQNVAYFYQHHPSLYNAAFSPTEMIPIQTQSQYSGQFMLHHHHFHHFHYHHLPKHNSQLKEWVDANDDSSNNFFYKPSPFSNSECHCSGSGNTNNLSHHESYRPNLLKGDDLIDQFNKTVDSNGSHFKPIGSEAFESRECLYQKNQALMESIYCYKTQSLLGDMVDETSSLDSSLEDAPDSIYSSISSCSSSPLVSCKVESTLSSDYYCDVNDDLPCQQQTNVINPSLAIKSSPMCSLTLSSLDESSISSFPSSPSSFTSNSSLVFPTELNQHDTLSNILQGDDIFVGREINKSPKLPRPIKTRKRKKKDKPISFRNMSSSFACFDTPTHIGQTSLNETFKFSTIELPNSTPPQRPWIPLSKPTESNISNVFTVMCYNVLCDKYATRQLYGYCPNWALSWDYRRNAIMQEIKNFDADIIALQEVETEQFFHYFQPQLQVAGYDGIFSPKSRAKTMSENERRHVDGCAIFYKTEKFSLVKEHLIEFNQLAMANAEGSDNMLNRVMTKDNIGLVALLQTKDNSDNLSEPSMAAGQPLVVCTAHIHWDPEYCDVKLIQTMMLMHELRNFVDEAASMFRLNIGLNKTDTNSIPFIFCGDLNSLPDSGVVEFLSNGRIAVEHPDFKELAYKDSLRKLAPIDNSKINSNEYTHAFDLIKAYKNDVMPFTNYTYDFKGVIDYIFCSKATMSVLGVLGPLDTNWLNENKIVGCPHQYIPSDHFPLVVELEMIPKILSSGMVSNSGSNASGAANGHISRR